MTEKNEAEDGNSISLKSPWHMKWDRQQFLPFFPVAEIWSIMHLLYFSYPQEILAQFVEWGKKVWSPYSPQWSVYFSISLLPIAGKHPVIILYNMILSAQCIKCISFTLHLTLINGQLLIYSPKHMRPQISTISAQITYQLSMQLSPRTSANRQWMRHRTNNPHKYSDICFRHWLF